MVSSDSELTLCFRALSDATRQEILGLLGAGQFSVHEIAEKFPMSRPAISKHLKILREAGLVLEERVGRERIYALEAAPFGLVADWLHLFNGRAKRSRGNGQEPRRLQVQAAESNGDGDDWRVW